MDFGEVRSAVHGGGVLPFGWWKDERIKRYVLDSINPNRMCAVYAPGEQRLTIGGGKLDLLDIQGELASRAHEYADYMYKLKSGHMASPTHFLACHFMDHVRHGVECRWLDPDWNWQKPSWL